MKVAWVQGCGRFACHAETHDHVKVRYKINKRCEFVLHCGHPGCLPCMYMNTLYIYELHCIELHYIKFIPTLIVIMGSRTDSIARVVHVRPSPGLASA